MHVLPWLLPVAPRKGPFFFSDCLRWVLPSQEELDAQNSKAEEADFSVARLETENSTLSKQLSCASKERAEAEQLAKTSIEELEKARHRKACCNDL